MIGLSEEFSKSVVDWDSAIVWTALNKLVEEGNPVLLWQPISDSEVFTVFDKMIAALESVLEHQISLSDIQNFERMIGRVLLSISPFFREEISWNVQEQTRDNCLLRLIQYTKFLRFSDGNTLAHLLLYANHFLFFQKMTELGMPLDGMNDAQQTVLDFARSLPHTDCQIIEFLRQRNALSWQTANTHRWDDPFANGDGFIPLSPPLLTVSENVGHVVLGYGVQGPLVDYSGSEEEDHSESEGNENGDAAWLALTN